MGAADEAIVVDFPPHPDNVDAKMRQIDVEKKHGTFFNCMTQTSERLNAVIWQTASIGTHQLSGN
jgi:hypothetical protein